MIITPGRWKLRRFVKIVNTILNLLKIEKHPDKTFIGRAATGFDFLGYRVKPGELSVSQNTIKRHFEHTDRLYEQGASQNRIREYVRRWFDWLIVGLGLSMITVTRPVLVRGAPR